MYLLLCCLTSLLAFQFVITQIDRKASTEVRKQSLSGRIVRHQERVCRRYCASHLYLQ